MSDDDLISDKNTCFSKHHNHCFLYCKLRSYKDSCYRFFLISVVCLMRLFPKFYGCTTHLEVYLIYVYTNSVNTVGPMHAYIVTPGLLWDIRNHMFVKERLVNTVFLYLNGCRFNVSFMNECQLCRANFEIIHA